MHGKLVRDLAPSRKGTITLRPPRRQAHSTRVIAMATGKSEGRQNGGQGLKAEARQGPRQGSRCALALRMVHLLQVRCQGVRVHARPSRDPGGESRLQGPLQDGLVQVAAPRPANHLLSGIGRRAIATTANVAKKHTRVAPSSEASRTAGPKAQLRVLRGEPAGSARSLACRVLRLLRPTSGSLA